ncbi:MAG TPA: NAD(P)-binding protein, partial [Hymenobacter sp.]
MTDCDFLVVGHGIAGATLAYVLRQRGHRVLV